MGCAHCGGWLLGGVEFEGKIYCGTCRNTVEWLEHYNNSGAQYSASLDRLKVNPSNPDSR